MNLFFRLFRHLLPVGLVAGIGVFLFSSLGQVTSDRVDAFGVDGAGIETSSLQADPAALAGLPLDRALLVREVIDWSLIETSAGSYTWSNDADLDLRMAAYQSRGEKVIGELSGGPLYLVTSADQPVDEQQLLLRWAAFVQAVVDRYGDQVDIWEIGSGINTYTGISSFLYPLTPSTTVSPDPAFYARLVKTASAVIKTKDPNDELWTGSLVGFSSSHCAMSPSTFLLELHGANAWTKLDGIDYAPDRGAVAPEAEALPGAACPAAVSGSGITLSGDVRIIQDLARQLGSKPVRISGLGWNADQLAALGGGRSISSDQLQADFLVRSTVPLLAANSIPSAIWSVNLSGEPASTAALVNLSALLTGSRPVGQVQGQTGSVFEYRFTRGSQTIIIAWRAMDGDLAAPVNISNLSSKSLQAYAVDAPSLGEGSGVAVPVDETGNALIMLNERPVIFVCQNSDWKEAIQQNLQDKADQIKYDAQNAARHSLNDLKAELLHWLEGLFDSAKDQAVDWGEGKINELLN